MNSALGQNDHYLCYISAIWEGPLHVTAKLTEMVQYCFYMTLFTVWLCVTSSTVQACLHKHYKHHLATNGHTNLDSIPVSLTLVIATAKAVITMAIIVIVCDIARVWVEVVITYSNSITNVTKVVGTHLYCLPKGMQKKKSGTQGCFVLIRSHSPPHPPYFLKRT